MSALPHDEKTELLMRLVGGAGAHLGSEVLRRFRDAQVTESPRVTPKSRTVGELRAAAETRADERHRQQAERAAREKARREREAAEARERHLAALARREAQAWREVDGLIAAKKAKQYDEAVALLRDLREVCARAGREAAAAERIVRLHEEHSRKAGLIERLRKAGLLAPAAE